MKKIDAFLLHDFFKVFKKCDIGFVIDGKPTYNNALASLRMRCYDMIWAMEKMGITAELYKPNKKYKAVIFTKTRSDKSVNLARRLYEQGVIVISDAFCTKVDEEDDWERKNILKIVETSNCVVTYSKSQYEWFCQYHNNVRVIEESVNDIFFKVKKTHENKDRITLVYCGYAGNARDTLVIKDVIEELQQKYQCRLLLICEKDPGIKELSYEFVKYNQKVNPIQLLEGDIMIAPRPMEGIDKLAHTLSKIAHPMAVGLPVVANPVPSYVGSPAILCINDDEWKQALVKLIENRDERERVGNISRKFIEENYSQKHICQEYLDLINELTSTETEPVRKMGK